MGAERPPKPMSMSEVVGANVEAVCHLHGWDKDDLGHELRRLGWADWGSGPKSVERLFKGQRGLTVDQLLLLALALRVSIFALICPPPGVFVTYRGVEVIDDGGAVLGVQIVHVPGEDEPDYTGREHLVDAAADLVGDNPKRRPVDDDLPVALQRWERTTWDAARMIQIIIAPEVRERVDLIDELLTPALRRQLNEVDWDWEKAGVGRAERYDLFSLDQLRKRRAPAQERGEIRS